MNPHQKNPKSRKKEVDPVKFREKKQRKENKMWKKINLKKVGMQKIKKQF